MLGAVAGLLRQVGLGPAEAGQALAHQPEFELRKRLAAVAGDHREIVVGVVGALVGQTHRHRLDGSASGDRLTDGRETAVAVFDRVLLWLERAIDSRPIHLLGVSRQRLEHADVENAFGEFGDMGDVVGIVGEPDVPALALDQVVGGDLQDLFVFHRRIHFAV